MLLLNTIVFFALFIIFWPNSACKAPLCISANAVFGNAYGMTVRHKCIPRLVKMYCFGYRTLLVSDGSLPTRYRSSCPRVARHIKNL